MNDLDELLRTVSRILGTSFLISYAILLVWAGVFFWAGGPMINVPGQWFGLTPHECALVNYCGMGLMKIIALVFFLSPYLAIKIVLRKRRGSRV